MSFPALNIQLVDCVKGKARDFDITIALSSGSLVVADITNAWLTVKANEADAGADALFQKEIGAGITLTGVSGSSVVGIVQLSAADTDLLTAGRTYYFDLQVDTTAREAELAARGRLACR